MSSMDQLSTLMTEVLECNRDLSQRMINVEQIATTHYTKRPSTSITGNLNPSLRPDLNADQDNESLLTIRGNITGIPGDSNGSMMSNYCHSFEKDLNNTRPYVRAIKKDLSWSPTSSAIQSIGWSCLSGLSLADVSEISVINLPITPSDTWNGRWYCPSSTSVVEDSAVLTEPNPDVVQSTANHSLPRSNPNAHVGRTRHLRTESSSSQGSNNTTVFDAKRCEGEAKKVAILGTNNLEKTLLLQV